MVPVSTEAMGRPGSRLLKCTEMHGNARECTGISAVVQRGTVDVGRILDADCKMGAR